MNGAVDAVGGAMLVNSDFSVNAYSDLVLEAGFNSGITGKMCIDSLKIIYKP